MSKGQPNTNRKTTKVMGLNKCLAGVALTKREIRGARGQVGIWRTLHQSLVGGGCVQRAGEIVK